MLEVKLKTGAPRHDRRAKERIYVPFPATVHWLNDEGQVTTVETVLDNLSSDGLYMRMLEYIAKGTRLSIEIALTEPYFENRKASHLQVEGIALRTERKPGGVLGVAVALDRVRFL